MLLFLELCVRSAVKKGAFSKELDFPPVYFEEILIFWQKYILQYGSNFGLLYTRKYIFLNGLSTKTCKIRNIRILKEEGYVPPRIGK